MPRKDAVLVLDCGATNVRAIAVSEEGRLLASRSLPNAPVPDPGEAGGRIWDLEAIWASFAWAARTLGPGINARIGAVTVTTFGVDGTLVDGEGALLHPVISWQCGRTRELRPWVEARIPDPVLYARCGLQPLHINTIHKLAWFRTRHPELLERARAWLFMSNVFTHRMTGVPATDATMAGTSMLTDLGDRSLCGATLGDLGLDPGLFPPWKEPGEILGELLPGPARELGLEPGLPVVSAGHDTQFALFGSGAAEGQAVLSSGTWEILMARSRPLEPSGTLRREGVTLELDAEAGLVNPGLMWIASGLVEWLKDLAFAGEREEAFEAMIREGETAGPGAGGLVFRGDALEGQGSFRGLGLGSTRGQMARALFEHLGNRTRHALELLERSGGVSAPALICVGGGSRNRLWNRIRADMLQRPLHLLHQPETTALGAACFALPALGRMRDAREARAAAPPAGTVVEPGPEAAFYREQAGIPWI